MSQKRVISFCSVLMFMGLGQSVTAQDLPMQATFKSEYDPVTDRNEYHIDFFIQNLDDNHAPIHSKDLNQFHYNAAMRKFDPGYTWIKREVYHNGRLVEDNPLPYIVLRMRGYHPRIEDGNYSENDRYNPDFRYELCYRFCDEIVSDDQLTEGFGTPIQVYKPNDDEDVALHAIGSWGDITEALNGDTQYGDYSFRYVYMLNNNIRRYTNFVDFNVPVSGMSADPLGTYTYDDAEIHTTSLPEIDNRTYVTVKTLKNTVVNGQNIVAYSIIDLDKNELCRLTGGENGWSVSASDYSVADVVDGDNYQWVILETPIKAGEKVYARMEVGDAGSSTMSYYGISPKNCILPSLVQSVDLREIGRFQGNFLFSSFSSWNLEYLDENIMFSQWRKYNDKTYGSDEYGDSFYMNILDHNQATTGSMPQSFYEFCLKAALDIDSNELISDGSFNYSNIDILSQPYDPDKALAGEYVLRAYVPSVVPEIDSSLRRMSNGVYRENTDAPTKYVVIEDVSPVQGHQNAVMTGVEDVEYTLTGNSAYYNLMGQRIDDSQAKGLVIEVKDGRARKIVR